MFGKIKHGKLITGVLRATLYHKLHQEHFTRPDISFTPTGLEMSIQNESMRQVSIYVSRFQLKVDSSVESRVEHEKDILLLLTKNHGASIHNHTP